ncbi:tetratricopeptide repeat protein [Polycladidibacter hongkongensis]|uniref:tetratricopeptide repeat protein n=1 Tax=Polycladidibacter hongkongensis TaxID=1647556 RepID=UPI00155DEEA3|nr:tetratricopeptide repeat protein [Pseudovibrio hongkongensis]
MTHSNEHQGEVDRALRRVAVLEKAGRFKEALPIYKDLIGRFPEEIEVLYQMALSLMRGGDLREAINTLRKVLFMKPEHLSARTSMGNALYLLGYPDQAEAAFSAVLEVAPQERNALYGMALLSFNREAFKTAQSYCQRLLDIVPSSAAAHVLMADTLAALSSVDVAIVHYRNALRSDPTMPGALFGLAKLLVQRKRPRDARAYLENAYAQQPHNQEIKLALAQCLVHEDQAAEAASLLESIHECEPDNLEVLLELSAAERRLGNNNRAVGYAAQAYRLMPQSQEVGNRLGSALSAIGEKELARELLTAMAQKRNISLNILEAIRDIGERELKATGDDESAPDTDETGSAQD